MTRPVDKIWRGGKWLKNDKKFFDFKVLKDPSRHFKVGSGHHCTVLKVNQEQKSLDLSMSGIVILLQTCTC